MITRPRFLAGTGRYGPLVTAVLPLVLACAGAPPPATRSVVQTQTAIERLLELSQVESIISARASTFTRRVALEAGDLTDPELERLVTVVQREFAPERLLQDIIGYLESESAGAAVAEVLDFMENGANAERTRITDAYEPPLSLEEFATSLGGSPPSPERTDVIVDWVTAQEAGDFFVLLDQALGEAAHAVVSEFRTTAGPFEPISGDFLAAESVRSFNAAAVTFLYRFETVPDDVLRRATAEYSTPSGQWFVRAYSLAIAHTIRAAGERSAAALRRDRP